jgi:membrane protein implicated in regulation of membrane protease activity
MIGRLTRLRGRLSSHWLASIFALTYLLVSILLGVALLNAPKVAAGAAAPVASTPTIAYPDPTDNPAIPVPGTPDDSGTTGTTTTTTTTRAPTTTTSPAPFVPAGYQPVTGPAGLRTVIPAGWHPVRTTGPGAMQATDPADADRFVKYGGSVASDLGIEPAHIQYENGFALRTPDYKRLELSSAAYDGHDAVVWEFEHRDGGAVLHVRSLYWRANGKEYFVLASAPASRWDAMAPIYNTMVANASP